MHHIGHVGHEIVVIAFAGNRQMMGMKCDSFQPWNALPQIQPMAQARTALMLMAVGMKGRTQAVDGDGAVGDDHEHCNAHHIDHRADDDSGDESTLEGVTAASTPRPMGCRPSGGKR